MDLINNTFRILAAAEAAAGQQSIAEQFGFDWTKLIAQALTFIAVWAILKWKAFGPILEMPVSYTHLRAHETVLDLVCRLLLEKKKK